MKAYEALKRAGKIRFAGIATHRNEPAVIRAAAKSGFWDVVLTAFNFRQSHREEVRAAIHEAAEAGLGIMAMKTQAGVYWDARRRQKINMQAALRWVLRDEHVHSTVPAFSSYDELEEDLAVARDPALRPEDERDLRLGEQAGLAGLYCQQCGACVPQCPAHADVPLLMRGYMYAVGHGRPQHARHVLRAWTPADIPCRVRGLHGALRARVRCAGQRARPRPHAARLSLRPRRRYLIVTPAGEIDCQWRQAGLSREGTAITRCLPKTARKSC